MKRSVICLTALQLLTHAKAYAYANEAECISALTTTQSDASLVKMICTTATYTPPKTEDDIRWEKEKEELQFEAETKSKQEEIKAMWLRIEGREAKRRAEEEKERQEGIERARLYQERLKVARKVSKCDQINKAMMREVKSGRPRISAAQIAKNRFDSEFIECKRICTNNRIRVPYSLTLEQSEVCRHLRHNYHADSWHW
jgi:hypothetical protein